MCKYLTNSFSMVGHSSARTEWGGGGCVGGVHNTPQPKRSTFLAGPDGLFVSTGACNLGVSGSNPGRADICHCGCAYTVLQTVQMHGVYSAAYGTVHYKEALKSFEIRVGHSPGFGLPSVATLPRLCRKRRKTIFIIIVLTFFLGMPYPSIISTNDNSWDC